MNDTPRTDKKYESICESWSNSVSDFPEMTEFARQLERELIEARAKIERLETAGIHSCHKDCQRLPCVLRRERDKARRLAEKYRNLSCDSQDEADETLLPWETTNLNEL